MNEMSNLNIAIRFVKGLLKRPMRASEDIKLRMLQHRLLHDITYRLPNRAKNDLLIGFKEWKRIVSRKIIEPTFISKAPCLLVSTSNQKEIAEEYVTANSQFKTLNILVREELTISNFPIKYHLFALRISIQCLFDSRRVNLALLIREVVEWTNVSNFIFSNSISEIFDFTPFEKDSNALAYLLIEQGIKVTKIPSPGPLTGHNTFMIADDVVVSSAYQMEEIPGFSHWYISRILHWPPEQYLRYSHFYTNAPLPPKKTLGFYSHGEWVRRKAGHAKFGQNIQENEMFILESLQIFLKKHSDFQLIIFPHPKERKDSEFKHFYSSLFQDTNSLVAPTEMKSSENFFKVNIGVMAYSTLIFERLALGYKTFIGTQFQSSFPIEGSPLNNLCLSNYETFEEAIILAHEETEKEFFDRRGLKNYSLKEFLNQKVVEIQK
jgi:hypothetical protein